MIDLATHAGQRSIASPEALRLRHIQLSNQVRHTFEKMGLHRNDDGSPFAPRVRRIAWTADGDIALVQLDDSRLWHIPSSRLTNADTLGKLRRNIGQPVAWLATDHTGVQLPGIWYVVSYAERKELPASLRLTLNDIDAIAADRLLVPVGQFKGTDSLSYRTLIDIGHCLIGSATQRGKTSLLNAWIGALAARNSKDRYWLYILDAKATTLHRWRGLPHLRGYATEADSASDILNHIEGLANRHFATIRSARCENWPDYNSSNPDHRLPAVHVVIDELPDFVFESGGAVGSFSILLSRLAGKVLGAGIFLTIAGTDMGAEILPPMLRGNMITRVGFQMSTRHPSLSVLNAVGAEKLPAIKGRALWRDSAHPNELIETQMVYLDKDDVDAIVSMTAGTHDLDQDAGQDAPPAFVPTIDTVSADLALSVAEWVIANTAGLREVWNEFKSQGLSRDRAGRLLAEWESQGLLGTQPNSTSPRPVAQKFVDLMAGVLGQL